LYGDLVGSAGLLVGVREALGVRVDTGVSAARVEIGLKVTSGVGVHVAGNVGLGVRLGAGVNNAIGVIGLNGLKKIVGFTKMSK
jgi:hypothetical protein